ncbi:MAG: hypothetical protein HY927_04150 [Elusimicrobia bacterium]|nr:hypothetical protein [Elusimicrobiota bacterium]
MQVDIARFLSSDGPLARLDASHEERPQQLAMALAVHDALWSERDLAVEAGTGVGKSLAYLLPGGIWACAPAGERRRLVVSTHTRTLQEQLMNKELPLVRQALRTLGLELDYAMLMGSDNYLCLRRLARARRTPELFDRGADAVLEEVLEWAREASSGHRSALPALVPEGVWWRICRDPDLCLGNACGMRESCLYRKDWQRAEASRVLVVNHALLLSSPRLPPFQALVVDEAHSLEDAAISHYGIQVSDARYARVLAEAGSSDGRRGLIHRMGGLPDDDRQRVEDALEACRKGGQRFFRDVARAHGLAHGSRVAGDGPARPPSSFDGSGTSAPGTPGAARRGQGVEDSHARRLAAGHEFKGFEALRDLEAALAAVEPSCEDFEEAAELKAAVLRVAKLRHDIEAFLKTGDPSVARWVETAKGRLELRASPLEVASKLERDLLAKGVPVVMTSATLSAGRGLKDFKSRVGFAGASELVLDSPFDYAAQVGLLIVDDLPEPQREAEYDAAVAAACGRIIAAVPGGVFVLFSSWRMLRSVAAALRETVRDRPLWSQGESGNEALIEQFERAGNAVLFGVDTFWQGVDVHGGALSCVVMAKLPFPNFATPLEEARRGYMESLGRSYFEDHSVPRAVMKFRQGFGRLIRSYEDRGAVVVLDSRILHRRYGQAFMEALPRCKRLDTVSDLSRFLESVRPAT